jgi:hypothetical protein
MVLCLTFKDGTMAVVDFPGGPCDPGLKVAGTAPTSAVAKPGDDLQGLASRFGTIRLAKGTHRLARPLVLDHPITLTGEPGTTLTFAQGQAEPPWTAAIKVHRSHTTLQGFAIRFDGRSAGRRTSATAPPSSGRPTTSTGTRRTRRSGSS